MVWRHICFHLSISFIHLHISTCRHNPVPLFDCCTILHIRLLWQTLPPYLAVWGVVSVVVLTIYHSQSWKNCRPNYLFVLVLKAPMPHMPVTTIITLDRHRRPTGSVVGHCVRPAVCLSVPNNVPAQNSLRISAISLIFGGEMHSTMEQIAI